jgi:predicted porin
MKKSLIALAVLGAFAGVASAQSNVTLYGSIDVGIEKIPTLSTRVSNNNDSNGRIGFKGVEDLGGGLKASFVVETGFQGDTGGFSSNSGLAALGNRATWLSLGSKTLGTVSMGRGYAGNFYTQLKADPTGNSYGQGGDGAGFLVANNVNSRYDNTIRYQSPNLYGFTADVGVGLKGDAQSDTVRPAVDAAIGKGTRNLSSADNFGYNVGFAYNNGPIYVGLGTTRTPGRSATGIAAGSAAADANVTTLAGGYNFGIVNLTASIEHDNRYRSRANSWVVGASAPLGAGTLMAFYGEDRNGGVTLNDSLKLAQLTYSYALSKRTNVYASVSHDSVSGAGNTGNSYGSIDGTGASFGMNHKF